MKHFVSIIQNDETCACFAYPDKDAAVAKFHHEMEYAVNAGLTTLCMVVSANGAIVRNEKYTAPAPKPDGGEE